ncbi:hypothetical protein [Vibrio barjaei]|uniref:hypothetical protein n=1 Tax=Vibrio barjaei TaxID=1676683 RepID=UPI0022840F77|nr:hypothetical protein [Vibrio barjaei]MCY9874523.1 hypothetical protein [Vibrio barjaei]
MTFPIISMFVRWITALIIVFGFAFLDWANSPYCGYYAVTCLLLTVPEIIQKVQAARGQVQE